MTGPDSPALHHAALDTQLRAFVDEHRAMLLDALDGVSEAEARTRLVPSSTTLLGLLKHATFVEHVWFEEAATGASREELGLESGPEESFRLDEADTVESVRSAFLAAVAGSRAAVEGIALDEELPGNRRGPLPLRWILLHVLREHAQHCGHADILREQVIAARAGSGS